MTACGMWDRDEDLDACGWRKGGGGTNGATIDG